MKPTKLPKPMFYPLPDLAAIWGCSEAMVTVYVELGTETGDKLALNEYTVSGKKLKGVSIAEKARFEGARQLPGKTAINSVERKTYLNLIGALAITWVGEDPELVGHPYKLLHLLEGDAAMYGVPIIRSDDTNAAAIREGIAAVCAAGYLRKCSGE